MCYDCILVFHLCAQLLIPVQASTSTPVKRCATRVNTLRHTFWTRRNTRGTLSRSANLCWTKSVTPASPIQNSTLRVHIPVRVSNFSENCIPVANPCNSLAANPARGAPRRAAAACPRSRWMSDGCARHGTSSLQPLLTRSTELFPAGLI